MALPDRLNENPSARFASAPYAGPGFSPSEVRAEMARRRREEAALERQRERQRREAANIEAETTADEFGIRTQQAGSMVMPRVSVDPSSGRSGLEYEPQEITDTSGRQRKMDKAGRIEPVRQGPVEYVTGDGKTSGMADPTILYRREMAPEEIGQDGYDVGMRRPRKVEPVGRVDLLTDATDPEVQIAARQNMLKRNKDIFGDAKTLLGTRKKDSQLEAQMLREQIEMLERETPPVMGVDGSEALQAVELQRKVDEKEAKIGELRAKHSEAVQRTIDFGKQENNLNLLEKDAGHIEALNKAVANARARGEDPNKDPIVSAIRESYANLKMQAPEIEDPLYAGSMVNPVRGPMIDPGEGSPEGASMQERQGFSEAARQNEAKTLEDVKAQIAERKRRSEPILQSASDRMVEFNLKRATRDRLANRYNALLASQEQAGPEEANAIEGQLEGLDRIISTLDIELQARQQDAATSAAGAEAEKQFTDESSAMIEEAGKQKAAEGYRKANELISAQKKREEIATPPTVDQRPAQIDREINSVPEEQLPQKQAELVQQGALPPEAAQQSLPRNLLNQLVKGTFVANQRMMYAGLRAASAKLKTDPRMPTGIVDMILNPVDTGWMEEAAESAKKNAEWFERTFPTDEAFNQSYVGGVAKAISELPAQFAPYLATGGLGGVALGGVYNFAYLMDEAYQRYGGNPEFEKLNEVEKANFVAKYAMPAAVLDTFADKVTLGVFGKLVGRPMREAGDFLRAFGHLAVSSGTEGGTEVAQDVYLQKLGEAYDFIPESEVFTKDTLKTFAIAATVGAVAPVAIAGGRRMVLSAQGALDNRQQLRANQQAADLTSDVPQNGWASWMDDQENNYSPAPPEGQQLLGISARTSPLGPFAQLRGKVSGVLIEKGTEIDTQIALLEAQAARPADRSLLQKAGDALRADGRTAQLRQLHALYMERAAIASAAQTELKARDAVVREIGALPSTSPDGSYSPKASALAVAKFFVESPSLTEAELKLKMGKDPLFTKDMNGNTVPNQRFIDEVLPQLPAIQPFIERSKSTAAELGVQLAPEQTEVPDPAPIVSTPEQQTRRTTGDRLQGETPSERITSFARRIYDLNQKIVPALGQKFQIKLQVTNTEGGGYQTMADPDGVRIVISAADFKRLEANPEVNNRALNEEIFHAADKLSAYLEADRLGTDRETHYQERRTKLYSDLIQASKTDADILGALAASADIYFRGRQDIMRGELRSNPTGEGIIAAAEEQGVQQWRLMSEFMRQYKTRRRLTEAKVEAIAGSQSQSLMAQIAEYLKGIYRMLNNFTKGLNRNPELKAQFDFEMQKIDEILNMPEGGPSVETQEAPIVGEQQAQPENTQKSTQTKFAPDPTLGNRPDAVLALQALGFKRKEAEKMVSAADPALPSDEIVRSALGQTKKPGVVVRQGEERQPQPAPQVPAGPEGPVLASTWYPNPQMQIPEDRLYNPPPERPAIESASSIEAELGQREKIVKSPQGAEALRRQLAEQQKKGERNARRRARTAELKSQAEAQKLDSIFTPQLRNAFIELYGGPIREKLAAGAPFSALEPAEREEIISTLRDGAQSEGWLTQSRADLAQLAAETRSANDKQAFLDEAKRIEEFQSAAKEFVATLPKQKQAKAAAPAPAPRPQAAETAPVEYRVFTQNHPDTIVVGGARIVDLSELQDMEGTEIQPRQRKQRAGYDQEVERIAMNLNPEQLMPGTATGDGAPVVLKASSNPYRTSASNLFDIISGHGRTKALRTAYEKYPERASAYRETLLQKFPQFRQQILSANMPAVVTEMHLGESVKASNIQGKTKATPKQFLRRLAVRTNPNLATEERAVSDAREILDDPRLGMFRRETLIDDQGKPLPGNEDVLSLWFEAFGRDGTLLNSNGTYKPEFERRVRLALLASTMGDQGVYSDFDLGIIGTIAEAEQSGIGQLTNSLMHAAPGLKALRAEAAQQFPNDAEAFDPMVPIAAGLQAFLQERNSAIAAGRNAPNWEDVVDNVRSQLQGLEGATLNETSIALFAPIAEFSRAKAPAKMKAYLSGLTSAVRTALNEYRETGGKDMFGNDLPLAEEMNETIIGMARRAADTARGGALQARTSSLGGNFEKGENESGIDWLRRVYREYEEMNVDDLYITERDVAEQTRLMLDTEDMPGNTSDLETALQAYETAEMEDRMYYGMRSGEDVIQLDLFMKSLDRYLADPAGGLQARTTLPSDSDYLERRPPEPKGEQIQPDLFGEVEVPKTRSSEFTPEMEAAYLRYFPGPETSAAIRSLAKEFVNPDSISKGFTFEAFVDLVDDILIEVIPQAFQVAQTPMAYIDRAIKNNLRTRLAELEERFTSLDAPSDSPDAPPNEEGVTTAPADIEVSGSLDSRQARVVNQAGETQDVEAPSTESPDFLDQELSRDLYSVLNRLPRQVRDTFEGKVLAGKTFKEIARERGLRQGGWQVVEKEYQAAAKLLGEYLSTLSPEGVKRFKQGLRAKTEKTEFGLQARLSNSVLGVDALFARISSAMENNVEELIGILGSESSIAKAMNKPGFSSMGGIVEFALPGKPDEAAFVYSIRPNSMGGWTAIRFIRNMNELKQNQEERDGQQEFIVGNDLNEVLPKLKGIGGIIKDVRSPMMPQKIISPRKLVPTPSEEDRRVYDEFLKTITTEVIIFGGVDRIQKMKEKLPRDKRESLEKVNQYMGAPATVLLDDDGNPLTVYHGTPNIFKKFKEGRVWFTMNYEFAEKYRYRSLEDRLRGADPEGEVKELNIFMERPAVFGADDAGRLEWTQGPSDKEMERAGYDGVLFLDINGEIDTGYAFSGDQVVDRSLNGQRFEADYPRELFPTEQLETPKKVAMVNQAIERDAPQKMPYQADQLSLFARLSSVINEIEAGVVSTDPNERTAAYQAMRITRGLSKGRGPYGRGETAYERLSRFSDSALVPEALEIEFGFRVPQGAKPLSEIEVMRRRKAENVMNYYDLRRVMLKRNPALLREILRPAAITPGTLQYRKNRTMERDMMRASGTLRARTTLDLTRPESFDEVAEYLANEFPIDNVPNLLAAAQNGEEIGRGDLANPGMTEDIRQLVNAVDEARRATLTQRPDSVVEAEAARLADDPSFLTQILRIARDGGARASDSQILATKILIGRLGKKVATNPDSPEARQSYVLVSAYRKIATEWGRFGRQLRDSILSPADRNLEFLLTTILTKQGRVIQRKRLKKALGSALIQQDKDAKINALVDEIERLRSQPESQIAEPDPAGMARLAQQIQMLEQQIATGQEENTELLSQTESLKSDLAQARARARIVRDYRQKMAAMETRIKQLEAELSMVRAQPSYEEILEADGKDKLAQVDQALAKLGTSFGQLLAESDLVQLRSSETASQILESVKMTQDERKAVQLATLGYDPAKLKIRPERLSEIMKGLRDETARRFDRFLKGQPTKAQVNEFLRRMREGMEGSLLARMDEDGGERLSREQALEQIYKALGYTIEPKSGKFKARDENGKTNLFDLNKPIHAHVLASAISKTEFRFDNFGYSLYIQSILSGIPTQVANFMTTPFAQIPASLGRVTEAMLSYMLGKSGIKYDSGELGATPRALYETIPDTLSGAKREVSMVIKNGMLGVIEGFNYMTLAWEQEAGFFEDIMSGDVGLGRDTVTRESGAKSKSSRWARPVFRALTAADEFSKVFRGNINVGATAYRLGKMQGLSGPELDAFIAKEMQAGSTSWITTIQNYSLPETFNKDLPTMFRSSRRPHISEVISNSKSIGEVLSIFPGMLEDLNRLMEMGGDYMYELQSELPVTGRVIGIPVRLAFMILRSFNLFLRTSYGVLREGFAYAPITSQIGLAGRFLKAKKARPNSPVFQDFSDYDMFIKRSAQSAIGTVFALILGSAMEGDGDDDDKMFLITGSADKTPGAGYRTPLGHTPYIFRIGGRGGLTIDYSRVEPAATVLSTTVDLGRSFKRVNWNPFAEEKPQNVLIQKAIGDALRDIILAPGEKSFGKSRRDFANLFTEKQGLPGALSVFRDKITPITPGGIPLVRKFLTAPDDLMRDMDTDPFGARSLMYMTWPQAGAWQGMGLLKPGEEILPPKRDVEGRVRRRPGNFATRALLPGQAFYNEELPTSLQRFISSYNARFPNAKWNPKVPDRTITDPNTGERIYMTTQQYALMRGLAESALRQRLSNSIGGKDLASPTLEKRKQLAAIISDANEQARKIVAAGILRERAKGRIEQVSSGEGAGPR